MIFSDFKGPGAHFGSLGTHFEDISDFCDFGDVFPLKKQSLFGSFFDTCWVQFLVHFLVPFWKALFTKYDAKSISNGKHLEVMLMIFFGTGDVSSGVFPMLRNPMF